MLKLCLFLLYAYGVLAFEKTIVTRQSTGITPSDIPSQCNTTCAPLLSDAQTCGIVNTTCICSDSVRSSAVNCAVCIVKIVPSELTSLQEVADSEVQLCQEAKLPVPSVNLTAILMGNNGTSPSSSSSSSTPSSTTPSSSKTNSGGVSVVGAGRASILAIALSLSIGFIYSLS